MNADRTIEKLLRQQAALANFGSFAFSETDLGIILSEAARICAQSLNVPFTKICRYRREKDDLLVIAGHGWRDNVVGHVISQADETSTQGRAFVTGEPVILEDIGKNNSYKLPAFYATHDIISTVDVLIKGSAGPFGVLEADCSHQHDFDEHDINFLTGFANVVAEAVGTSERAATLQATLTTMQALVAEKEVLLEEKNTLASELQHRVRNNLQLVYGMLLRQVTVANQPGNEGVRAIARRVLSLATIYDHLLGHGLMQTIDFGAYLSALCVSLKDFQEKGLFDVTLACAAEPMELELDLVTSLGIIVAEVTSNAFLHAFPKGPGTIQVSLSHKHGKGILIIADNGIGFPTDVPNKRHGLGLITRLMEQAKGEAHLQSDEGTVWTLTFPLAVPALSAA